MINPLNIFINYLEYLETLLSKPGVLFAAPVDGIVHPTLTKDNLSVF